MAFPVYCRTVARARSMSRLIAFGKSATRARNASSRRGMTRSSLASSRGATCLRESANSDSAASSRAIRAAEDLRAPSAIALTKLPIWASSAAIRNLLALSGIGC
jgi:hypothetical protein